MFIKNLRLAVRQLFKNRRYTLLNMVGLSVGISACWIIFKIVNHEYGYEKGVSHLEQTYKFVTYLGSDGAVQRMGGTAPPLYQGVREELTGWEYVVPVSYQWVFATEVRNADGHIFSLEQQHTDIVRTDGDYFEMLPYSWLAGDPQEGLVSPDQVVLTESRARAYFPDLPLPEIIHQPITYYLFRDTVVRYVSGIVADLQFPSEFLGKEFIAIGNPDFASGEWTNTNGNDKVYVRLHANTNVEHFLAQAQALDERKWSAFEQERGVEMPKSKHYELLPLSESHFSTHVSEHNIPKMNLAVLYGLMGIGAFLLLLACINYINMGIAMIPQRSKEIGVRKTMGSSVSNLIAQFLIETALTGLAAIALSVAFSILGFRLLHDILPVGVADMDAAWGLYLMFSFGILLLITLMAGLYPAWMATKVKTVDVFKSQFSVKTTGARIGLQKALIVFQFTIAIAIVICAVVVGSQLRHTLKRDLGFVKDAVVLVDIPFRYWNNPAYSGKEKPLLDELKNHPGIEMVSLASPPLEDNYQSRPYRLYADGSDEPKETTLYNKTIDANYLELYQFRLLAGRDIRPDATGGQFGTEVILNETAVQQFGFGSPAEALGNIVQQREGEPLTVVGVVEDFHSRDFYTPITPMILLPFYTGTGMTLNIKLASQDPSLWPIVLSSIENTYAQFYPKDSFGLKFYDQTIEAMYQQERNLATLINLASGITILISCLGLFGLATLAAYRKTKEIGIRKVLGASVSGIVAMLSKDFVKLVLIAIVIASPVAWWAMNKWLEDFAYRIDIQWWMFALAGLAAVVIALLTVGWQAIRAAVANPVDSLRDE